MPASVPGMTVAAERSPCRVAVTGAAWPLGRRVVQLLEAAGRYDVHPVLRPGDEVTMPSRVDVVVHLAPGDHDALVERRRSAVTGTPELLAAAAERDAAHVVLLSSAMVYGAWPNNPVPLTEEAALRPDQSFAFARQLATVEQLVDDWRRGRRGRTAAVLRPVPAMAADGTSGLVRALAAGLGGRLAEDDVPAQFLHLDDLADAVVLSVGSRLDGVFNVAPDGSVPGPRVRALTGMPPRIQLPDRLAEWLADMRWRFQRGPIPPGLRPYTRSQWLVANDRLRAAGWVPTVTNEQAYVEGTEARWWTMLTPKRKQELSLGLAIVGVGAACVVAVVAAVRARRRRHRS